MSRPLALDLYCGQGGASAGIHSAGFDVIGCDIEDQPLYPFKFVRADALRSPFRLIDFQFVWASPPCQAYTSASHSQRLRGKRYPDLIEATRLMLAGHPMTCMENVPAAPLRADIVLSGAQFDLDVIRTRIFEISGFPIPFVLSRQHRGTCANGDLATLAGHGAQNQRIKGSLKWRDLPQQLRERLSRRNSVAGWRAAIGCDWMNQRGLAQAIPPDYSQFIAKAALRFIEQRSAA